jgi:hypothetical protein
VAPRVIAVTSAMGGCGVTTVALHLARAFAHRVDTCLIEGHRAAGAAERLGLPRAGLKTWPVEDRSSRSLRLAALPVGTAGRVMFAPEDSSADHDLVELASEQFGLVVVDVPVSTEAPARCSPTVFVVGSSRPGVARARTRLDRFDEPRAIVFNRTGPGGEWTDRRLESELGARAAVHLPHSPSLRDAEDDGRLLRRSSRWAARIERLADMIEGHSSPARAAVTAS